MGVLPKNFSGAKSDRMPWGTDIPVFPVLGVPACGVLSKFHQHSSRVKPLFLSLLRVIWVLLTQLLVSVMSGGGLRADLHSQRRGSLL